MNVVGRGQKTIKGGGVDFAVCGHVYISVGKSKRYSATGSDALGREGFVHMPPMTSLL